MYALGGEKREGKLKYGWQMAIITPERLPEFCYAYS